MPRALVVPVHASRACEPKRGPLTDCESLFFSGDATLCFGRLRKRTVLASNTLVSRVLRYRKNALYAGRGALFCFHSLIILRIRWLGVTVGWSSGRPVMGLVLSRSSHVSMAVRS